MEIVAGSLLGTDKFPLFTRLDLSSWTEQDRDGFTDRACKMDTVTSPVGKFRTVLSASGGNFIVQLLA